MDFLKDSSPFVAFVGAGASSLPPSSLPTWTGFNNLLLECLCERLAEFSGDRQPTNEMLSLFRARRDETRFFAPDFQAQLMEEEIGAEYFRVWQSLDTNAYGPVHAGLAELASCGRLSAIITTNFDRLIEEALVKKGVSFEVFHNQSAFDALLISSENQPSDVLPVIKIHGSIEDAASLIDTLRQRVVGRPKSLEMSIKNLLVKFPWLYLGFSGADFSYDPHYLGILDASSIAKGFIFLAREGAPIQNGISNLAKAYGTEKASIIHGDLSSWLTATFSLTEANPATSDEMNDNASLRTKNNIRQWVERLGYMAVVNISYSMLKNSGMREDALWLMRRTWKSYLAPEDMRSKSYDRYNYNYGMSLFETGSIGNPISLAEDMNNLLEWKEYADQSAYEFFARGYKSGKILASGAQLAAVLAYRGEADKAISLAAEVTNKAINSNNKLDLCDVAIASVTICDIVRLASPVALLKHCVNIAEELGDEPRRALLCVHLGRFLTYAGQFDEANEFIVESDRIARRLDLKSVLLASQATRGRWLIDSGESDKSAIQVLRDVSSAIHSLNDIPLFDKANLLLPKIAQITIKGKSPALCQVLLDLNRAAMFAENTEVIDQTLNELDELTAEHFLGYYPHYCLSYAECLLQCGSEDQRNLIPDLINRASMVGERSGNPWAIQQAESFRQKFSSYE